MSPIDFSKPLAIALLSGGIDSATAAALSIEAGFRVIGLSINYGQRHQRELDAAKILADAIGLEEHYILDVNIAQWKGSSLTDDNLKLPTKGVVANKIPSTYVPGRNTIFISIGLSLAEAKGASQLILGVNAIDYSGYPDCRPDYILTFQKLAELSSKAGREGNATKIWAPLVNWNKAKIVEEAIRLGVPIRDTWSCYAGGANPCGLCDSCRIRNSAFLSINRPDLCSPIQK